MRDSKLDVYVDNSVLDYKVEQFDVAFTFMLFGKYPQRTFYKHTSLGKLVHAEVLYFKIIFLMIWTNVQKNNMFDMI